jgi:septum formation protein
MPSDAEELEDGDPVEIARANAQRKAAAVDGERVLAVDTVVSLDGRIYGKPRDEQHARETLQALEGRTHEVVSGLTFGGRTTHATTRVTMRTGLVDWYVPHCEWQDRAGGYAIQGKGAALVSGIEGDYLNVVGLPLAALLDLAPDLLEPAR